MLMQILIGSLTAGAVYALVALGFVLIYKGTGVVHFGYGEQLTFGAYMALIGQSLLGLPFGLALLFALAASALLGWLIQHGRGRGGGHGAKQDKKHMIYLAKNKKHVFYTAYG